MQRLITAILIISSFVLINVVISEETAYPLKLIKALPVIFHEKIDPSGLTIYDNTLFTIADKHDDTIFRIQITDDEAILVPHIKFKLSEPVTVRRLDFEGITCDANGVFYLASETLFRVLRVDPCEEYSSWVTPSVRSYGEEKGFFQVPNTNIEGIAMVGENQFVLCAERQPRGIIEVDMHTTPYEIKAFKYDKTSLRLPGNRNLDFTGLFFENQKLYALQRNLFVISELVRDDQAFGERNFWSYQSIETSVELQYSDMTFGRGEGLCMDKERIYVILDNNGDHRVSDPNDRRPLLLIMQRPRSKSDAVEE